MAVSGNAFHKVIKLFRSLAQSNDPLRINQKIIQAWSVILFPCGVIHYTVSLNDVTGEERLLPESNIEALLFKMI